MLQLRGRGGGQILASVTEVGAPQAGHAVQVTLAVVVPQRQAITADHHPRTFFVEGFLIDERVNVVSGVGGLVIAGAAGRIEFGGHGGSPDKRDEWVRSFQRCTGKVLSLKNIFVKKIFVGEKRYP